MAGIQKSDVCVGLPPKPELQLSSSPPVRENTGPCSGDHLTTDFRHRDVAAANLSGRLVPNPEPFRMYIRYAQRLKQVEEAEYEKVPFSLQILTEKEIERLSSPEIAAYQARNELPAAVPETQSEEIAIAKAYLRQLLRFKDGNPAEFAKVPAVIREFSDTEVQDLGLSQVQALKMIGALPASLIPTEKSPEDSMPWHELDDAVSALCRQYPDLQKKVEAWQEEPENTKKLDAVMLDPRVQKLQELKAALEKINQASLTYFHRLLGPHFPGNPEAPSSSRTPYRCAPYGTSREPTASPYDAFGTLPNLYQPTNPHLANRFLLWTLLAAGISMILPLLAPLLSTSLFLPRFLPILHP